MKWNINIFTYIEPNFLLKVFFNDKEYLKKIINEIIYKFYRIDKKIEIKHNNLLLEYINMYPRITHFETGLDSDIVSLLDYSCDPFNRYIFTSVLSKEPKNRTIYSNYILPHYSNSSIPFSFGFMKNNKFNLIDSNVYYFEVHLDTFIFRKPIFTEILKIGIIDSTRDVHSFEKDIFFGIDFINNIIVINKNFYFLQEFEDILFTKGDIIGIGLEYLKNYEYHIFITLNGKKLELNNLSFTTTKKLKLSLSLKMYTGINVNFGNKEFLYDIMNKNKCNYVINSTNNKLISHFDVRFFKPLKSKIQMFINKNMNMNHYKEETIHNWT